jgi:ribosome-binding factor A
VTPELKFVLDQSIEYGVNMAKKIDDIMNGGKDA